LFKKGARPVIYQAGSEYDILPTKIQYRHVRFEPECDIDWTWEREWRICTDQFVLDPIHVTLIIPSRGWEERLRTEHYEHLEKMAEWDGLFGMKTVGEFPWHFIVLEDLGFDIPNDYK
jgi:hypothetical protein